ncbi:MAG: glycosyltransferase family 39 protein [Elusimicrobiota bacterium]|nr:glycosyltransferase family 39 protein [Elusimicrobiota bacterium]
MVWLILLISTIIRVWGINFAFPLRYGHIDESVVIFYTMRFFSGDFNPNPFFDYPTLYLYLLFFCYLLFFSGGFIAGKFDSIGSFIAFYNTNAVPFVLIGRFLTVVFSIGTIYLTYLFARKLFDKKTGLLSALFLSLSWQHILSSHYATTDITAVFFTLLSAFFVWDIYTKNDLKSYLMAGFFCGLSIATKYYGGIVFLAIILFGWKNKKYIGFSFLAVITAFFVGCPFAFIDYTGFLSRFFDRLDLIIGLGKTVPFSSISNNFDIFINNLGYFFSLSALAGFIYLILKRTKQHMFLLIITLIILLFFGTWQTLPGRYILALYPFFAIISATVISKIKNKYLLVFAIALFLVTTLPKIIITDILLSQKDTRVISREWVLKNIPETSKILRGPFCPEFPKDNYSITIDWYDKIKNRNFSQIQEKFDYVITSSLHSDPNVFTENLNKYGNKIYEISKESIGEFQNPTIKIWKLK